MTTPFQKTIKKHFYKKKDKKEAKGLFQVFKKASSSRSGYLNFFFRVNPAKRNNQTRKKKSKKTCFFETLHKKRRLSFFSFFLLQKCVWGTLVFY